jgi:flavin-binding protein dodecin
MTVAKVTEISATSNKGFEDAIAKGIARAAETLDDITGAWIQEQKVDIVNGRIAAYRVNLKVTFVLHGAGKAKRKK